MKKQLRTSVSFFILNATLFHGNVFSSKFFDEMEREFVSTHQSFERTFQSFQKSHPQAMLYPHQINVEDRVFNRIRKAQEALSRQQAAEMVRHQELYKAAQVGMTLEEYIHQQAAWLELKEWDKITKSAESRKIQQEKERARAAANEAARIEEVRKAQEALSCQQAAEMVRHQELYKAAQVGMTLEEYLHQQAAWLELKEWDKITKSAESRKIQQEKERARAAANEAARVEEVRKAQEALSRQQAAEMVRHQELYKAAEVGMTLEEYRHQQAALLKFEEQRKTTKLEENRRAQEEKERARAAANEAARIKEIRKAQEALARQQAAEKVEREELETASLYGISVEEYRRQQDAFLKFEMQNKAAKLRGKSTEIPNISQLSNVPNRFITNIYRIADNINRTSEIDNIQLDFERSSAKHNNCLFFSIVRNDMAYLEKIMGSKEIARRLLAVPEIAPLFNGRDFTPVRKKVFQDIKSSFDLQFKKSMPQFEGETISIKEVLINIKNLDYEKYSHLSAEAFLDELLKQNELLADGFADIISVLYGRAVYVLSTIGSGQVLNMNNGLYYDLSDLSGDAIFAYHKGVGGDHYSKLIPVK